MPREIRYATPAERNKILCPNTFDIFYCKDGSYVQLATDLLSRKAAYEAMEEIQRNPEMSDAKLFAVRVERTTALINFDATQL